MKQWKRILFSILSLIWGYVSLDYLYYAYRLLTSAERNAENYRLGVDSLRQLLGVGMFLLWFVILAVYAWLIRKASIQIDLLEPDKRTGKPKIHRKWFDLLMQGGLLLTGGLLRWCYLLFVLFPGRG